MLKNWCFWAVVLEKSLERPLDCKEIKPVNPKGNQSWVFIGRTDPEAEAPILWTPDAKNWLTGKDPDAGRDWRQEKKGMTEDEIVGWHHWLDGHESEWTPGVCSDSGPLSQRCCLTISFSVTLFSCIHQGLFPWVSSSHQVAKVLELQLQHQSFQWILRVDFL